MQQEEKAQKSVSMANTGQAEEWKEVGWCFGVVVPEMGVLLICHREWLIVLPTTCCIREQEQMTSVQELAAAVNTQKCPPSLPLLADLHLERMHSEHIVYIYFRIFTQPIV